MFLLIWRTWGILVIPILVVAFVLGAFLGGVFESAGLSGHVGLRLGYAIATLASAAAIWFMAKAIAGRPTRRLIDQATGREVLIRRDAGSLFFINTKYWAFIVLALGLLMCIVADDAPGGAFATDAASSAGVSQAAADASQSQ